MFEVVCLDAVVALELLVEEVLVVPVVLVQLGQKQHRGLARMVPLRLKRLRKVLRAAQEAPMALLVLEVRMDVMQEVEQTQPSSWL